VRSYSPVLYSAAFFALVATLVAATFLNPRSGTDFVRGAYLFANLAYYVAVIIDHRRGGASFMVAFFFAFFVALPSFVQVGRAEFPFKSNYPDHVILEGYAIMAIAQISMMIGFLLRDRRVSRTSRTSEPVSTASTGLLLRAVVLLTASCYAIIGAVGVQPLLLTRSERGIADESGSLGAGLQIIFVGRSVSLAAVIVLIVLLKKSSEVRASPGIHLLSLALVPAFLVLNWPPSLARFQLFGCILAVIAVSVSLFSTRNKAVVGAGAPFFLLFFFATIKSLGTGGELDFGSALGRNVSEYLTRVDFDAFKQVLDTIGYVAAGGELRNGENFLGALLFWVPRGVWGGKPIDSGFIVSTAAGYPYTNVSSPLVAESLISFGIVGIVVVMGLCGYFLSSMEGSARTGYAQGRPALNLILYALVTGFAIIILRGALNGVAPLFGSAFLIYYALSFVARRQGETLRGTKSRERLRA